DQVHVGRVGRGARRRDAPGDRHRDRDLPRRALRDARERSSADAAGAIGSEGLTVAPALPPWGSDEAGADEPAPPLEEDVSADVCVVGGGYTGLWAALAVKEREPSARVVVIEAVACESGERGRCGGVVLDATTGMKEY